MRVFALEIDTIRDILPGSRVGHGLALVVRCVRPVDRCQVAGLSRSRTDRVRVGGLRGVEGSPPVAGGAVQGQERVPVPVGGVVEESVHRDRVRHPHARAGDEVALGNVRAGHSQAIRVAVAVVIAERLEAVRRTRFDDELAVEISGVVGVEVDAISGKP